MKETSPRHKYYLAIDLGTGSVKAALMAQDGTFVRQVSEAYPVTSPSAGWVESAPQDWWRATVKAVQACVREESIAAIGLSGQMHTLVQVDKSGEPLRPAILWADARSTQQLTHYRALSSMQQQCLANPLVTGMAGVSLLWSKECELSNYKKTAWVLSAKDWIRFKLTGEFNCEPTDASATLMYDLQANDWAKDILQELGLRTDYLPPLLDSNQLAGRLSDEVARQLCLTPGVSVVAGAADTAAAMFGLGIVEPGIVQIVVGTGMQVITIRNSSIVDHSLRTHLFRACNSETELLWLAQASMLNGGVTLEWVRKILKFSWDEMYEAAFSVPSGSDGLLFLPYLTGERTPHMNPQATGSWLGMRLYHEPGHLARAAFEGVIFSLKSGLIALQEAGVGLNKIQLAGGGTEDKRWRQLVANVLGQPVYISDYTAASARGAALLASMADGGFEQIRSSSAIASTSDLPIEPHADNRLDDAYQHFINSYNTV